MTTTNTLSDSAFHNGNTRSSHSRCSRRDLGLCCGTPQAVFTAAATLEAVQNVLHEILVLVDSRPVPSVVIYLCFVVGANIRRSMKGKITRTEPFLSRSV